MDILEKLKELRDMQSTVSYGDLFYLLPEDTRKLWVKRDKLTSQLREDLSCIINETQELMKATTDPLVAIGKPIIKASRKPFKGGETEVIVTGIIKHPQIDVYAFTYDYVDHGITKSSYCEVRQCSVIFNFMDMIRRVKVRK